MTTAEKIYAVVARIPKGKVTTYGRVAQLAKIKSPRVVGNILHRNPDPRRVPCHRVVNVQGKLAKNFGLGGLEAQAQKLRGEGIKIIDGKVDLSQYLWSPRVK